MHGGSLAPRLLLSGSLFAREASIRKRLAMALSSSASASESRHPPSRFVADDDGRKWRLCAGAAVLNSRNEVLIGERIGKPGSWQTPQGGVDGGENMETVTDAAVRELYEEVGLRYGRHVVVERMDGDAAEIKCRYETGGTGSWLERAGFAGQELNWVVLRCADAELEGDPSLACDLAGLGGEKPEFSAVRWERLDRVVDDVWEKKAEPYRVLKEACAPVMKRWEERCVEIDFAGRWSRDSERNVDVAAGLAARGLSEEEASEKAGAPYVQSWRREATDGREWIVTTYYGDGLKPRRELHYPVGEFEEAYSGTSTLFGGTNGGVVKRCCFYLAERDSDSGIAHVTISETPRGREESRRYLKNGELVLRRSFSRGRGAKWAVSTEIFTKC